MKTSRSEGIPITGQNMRRHLAYFVLSLGAVAAVVASTWFLVARDRFDIAHRLLASAQRGEGCGRLTILSPLDKTLFPPDIAPPTFRWADQRPDSDAWLVTVELPGVDERVNAICSSKEWTPSEGQWQVIREGTVERDARVTILGFQTAAERVGSKASITIRTSRDEVGAPIFYREVKLPFLDAIRDPSQIRWRFGDVSSRERPPIVLERLPVCGNCHSFSADGKFLGMDIDYANDKGSYAITRVSKEIVLEKSKIISWADYRKEDGRFTFGMLSQLSPDGRYVVSTVKDRSVFVPRKDLAFSQLFFPIQGILVVYDRKTKTFQALPGADDEEFVQTNPVWSPDGKYVVFARSKTYHLRYARSDSNDSVLLMPDECQEFLDGRQGFTFDLYRIPFNNGKGGTAEPLAGASGNGMSNYFPKYSPDGKWIVFCRAKNFMLLQPDSQLYIIPAEGGEPRRLSCNTDRMNSWHSWSPNSKWLVFSSKVNSPYTQLFLTHIDERGHSSPPFVLSRFTSPDRAANIPEFVSIEPGDIKKIREAFVDEESYLRSGLSNAKRGNHEQAVRAFQKILEMNPDNEHVPDALGTSLLHLGRLEEAKAQFLKSVRIAPSTSAYCNLGTISGRLGKPSEAASWYRKAVEMDPEFASARFQLGTVLMGLGQHEEATRQLSEAVRLAPDDIQARFNLAAALLHSGQLDPAVTQYRYIIDHEPEHLPALLELATIRATSSDAALRDGDEAIKLAVKCCALTGHRDAQAVDVLGMAYAEAGRFSEATTAARSALEMARIARDEERVPAIRERLRLYEQNQPFRQSFVDP